MINSYGTIIMIDPLLKGFDMPLLVDMVAKTDEIDHIDGYFVSHVDNDHYSRATLRDLKDVAKEIHTSYYVASLMKEECDAAKQSAFNGNPQNILDHVVNPDRVVILVPGEEYIVE